MGTRTAVPRGRYGERPQRDSVWKIHMKKHHLLAGDSPWRHQPYPACPPISASGRNIISFFVFTDWFVWKRAEGESGKSTVFLSTMASTSKAFRKCVDPCPRYLTPDDTHDCCVFCLGMEHARDVFEGAVCVHCERLPMRTLRSRLSLFSRKGGQPSASRDSSPTAAEARRRMKSWGSQADLADEFERELSLSHESAKNESEPLDYDDVISLTSSDPAASALLGYAQEEQEMSESEDVETELSQDLPAYEELLDVMECATARLDLPWERTKMAAPRGRLDERFLPGHKTSAQVNLPFLPDLHTEVEKEWKKPFSARIHKFQCNSYANIAGMRENGYERMPPVEETLASYLSMGEHPLWRFPPCHPGPFRLHHAWMAGRTQQQVKQSPRCTPWRCFRRTRRTCWRTWIAVRACHLTR